MSTGTAKTHRRNIYQKLGVSNLRELLAKLSR
ncbi:LuxR C-terminal-related transcriptional regulator [Thermodesulfitimonas autotrophica]|nr:LuxR C-terminal-related transcriptional regulator [Thermodesulfitimonas autotrophica]